MINPSPFEIVIASLFHSFLIDKESLTIRPIFSIFSGIFSSINQ